MTTHDMPDELCGCDACIAEDVALLASSRDPLARVAAMLSPLTLPPGWTIRHNSIGYAGTDSIVYDADGAWVGCYGHAAVSHRSNGAPASAHPWIYGGRPYATEQQCIDAIVKARAAG